MMNNEFMMCGIIGGGTALFAFILSIIITCIQHKRRKRCNSFCSNNSKSKIINKQKQDIINEIINKTETNAAINDENHVYTGIDKPIHEQSGIYENPEQANPSASSEQYYEKCGSLNLAVPQLLHENYENYENLENSTSTTTLPSTYQPYEIMPDAIMESLDQTYYENISNASFYEVLPDD